MSENNIANEIKDSLQKEEKSIEQLEHQIEDLSDRLLRSMAESENIRRRYEKQIEEIRDYSITAFAKDLIAVLDNLEMAIKFQPQNPSLEVKSIIDGVIMTQKELSNILAKHGITTIEPKEGEKFDYNSHFAISQVEHDTHGKDTIVGLMQAGYKIKDRLLRPASVSVAKEKE
jgi:molecular chaperone GrpE